MNVADILGQFEQLVDRSRAALEQQVSKTQKLVDNLTVEKTAVAKALAELQAQHGKAKSELAAAMNNLDRVLSLGSIQAESKKAGAELERLQGEVAKETKALEVLVKKQKAAEARVVTLENDARAATAERCRAQEMMARIRQQVESLSA